MSSPWIIAHRGASADRPENTLAAFDEALRQGCDGIETDVQLSRDGVPVIFHDRTLARAGVEGKRVADLGLSELRELDVGGRVDNEFRGQHIASLEEILDRYGQRTRLLIEIKTREGWFGRARHAELARSAATLVRRMKLERETLVLSFDRRVLDVCAAAAPGIRRALNVRPPATLGRRLARRLTGLFGVSADVRSLTPAFGAAIREGQRALLAFTCNTEIEVDRALAAGATAVMSDRPGWLARTIGERGRR